MRPLRTVTCLLVLACLFPSVSLADDFWDYRIPDHRGSFLGLSLGGLAARQSDVVPGVSQRETDWNGQGSVRASWFFDSDPRSWNLSVSGTGQGSWSHRVRDGYVSPDPASSYASLDVLRESRAFEAAQVSGGLRIYPGSGSLGVDLSGLLRADDSQLWSTTTTAFQNVFGGMDQRIESQTNRTAWVYDQNAAVTVAAGWGQVRDATPVFDALLLLERLDRDHALARPLSPSGRQRLVDLFAVRGSFSLVHDLPQKFFWEDVERILREDGALAEGGIHAFPLRHGDDPLIVSGGFFGRKAGFFVGPVISAMHFHGVFRIDETNGNRNFVDGTPVFQSIDHFGQRSVTSTDQTFYGGSGEYHRPVGMRMQLDAFEEALVDVKGDPDGLLVQGQLQLARLIGERWFATVGFAHARELDNRPSKRSVWDVDAFGRIAWYLEDFVRLDLEMTDSQSHRSPGSSFVFFPPVTPEREILKDFRTTLRVTFSHGHFAAPGLGVDERPLN